MTLTLGCGATAPPGEAKSESALSGAPGSRAAGSLKAVAIPEPSELAAYVRDRQAAIVLGKAFFWDTQAGSDAKTACASCHFQAGADGRVTNTVNPGKDAHFEAAPPMGALTRSDFPLHKLLDPTNQSSAVLGDRDDVIGSQGVLKQLFVGVGWARAVDYSLPTPDPTFQMNGVNTRQVTGRNAPSVINAVFNHRNFWDGRANFFFNGVSPFGARDLSAHIWVDDGAGMTKTQILMDNASLASQAVGPALNGVEMSAAGRSFPLLGRKLMSLRPLGLQRVHPYDSVLGAAAVPAGHGLTTTYSALIKRAFAPRLWKGATKTPDGFSHLEANFSLFWGLAIQMYESTLVSDDAPLDRFMEGSTQAMSLSAQRGMSIFNNQGRCASCHAGAELTSASVSDLATIDHQGQVMERMKMAGGAVALYDHGFYNLGVRPTREDPGVGGTDPFGHPLSFSGQTFAGTFFDPLALPIDPCKFRAGPCNPLIPGERVAVGGAFKVPSLRNVELTGPYMHNGGMSTLRQVLEFYNRHGDFRAENLQDFDPDLDLINAPLDLPGAFLFTETELTDLESFLVSLTDERVRRQMAPFDHPELTVPNGPSLPAVGAGGGTLLKPFVTKLAP